MDCYIKDYPRPQFVRSTWENLNGQWNFAFDDENVGIAKRWYSSALTGRPIRVPFSYETKLSGIGDTTPHGVAWYQRCVELNGEEICEKKVILNFEGSDYFTSLWVNGKFVGEHEGGYARFSFDITPFSLPGENTVTVRVEDQLDDSRMRGKQRWAAQSYGCWYVQTTGIWKTVWMEFVPLISLRSVKMTPDSRTKSLKIEYAIDSPQYENLELETSVSLKGRPIARVRTAAARSHGKMTVDLESRGAGEWGVQLWSPEMPSLYDVTFTLFSGGRPTDTVGSYFGLRDIRIDGGNVLLNGSRIYQRLVLNQGYWPESHLTPPDEDSLLLDIQRIKELGFNGARMHQKIEDERWLYWCDVKGLFVWGEAPSAYRFEDDGMMSFIDQWMEIVGQNYNHPCIITWVPFNESWGIPAVKSDRSQQSFCEAVSRLTKAFDPERPVISNDGWEHTVSDILTLHDYHGDAGSLLETYRSRKDEILSGGVYYNLRASFSDGYGYSGQPVILSECGGFALAGTEQGWGYGEKEVDAEAFLDHYEQLMEAVHSIPYLSGYCYTQLTDTQQEINGLLDEKRNFKEDCERIRRVNMQIPDY